MVPENHLWGSGKNMLEKHVCGAVVTKIAINFVSGTVVNKMAHAFVCGAAVKKIST